jgi:uncharacterized YccA/Bax inhibitor family protein
MMRSGNPVLNDKTFTRHVDLTGEDCMTIMGTVHKTAFLLVLLVITASATWGMVFAREASVFGFMIGGAIGGLIFALITIFKPTWAPVTAPIYAALEGLFIGALSAFAESQFPGIVLQAVGLTFGTLFALLGAYRSGLIKATENFKLGVCAATGGICLVYMVSIVLRMFGSEIPLIHEAGWVGIGFSAFVVVIAALNLVLDFDFIENGADQGAPKYMEWLGAFGLMVTLVWLYIEILHLLMKLRSR